MSYQTQPLSQRERWFVIVLHIGIGIAFLLQRGLLSHSSYNGVVQRVKAFSSHEKNVFRSEQNKR